MTVVGGRYQLAEQVEGFQGGERFEFEFAKLVDGWVVDVFGEEAELIALAGRGGGGFGGGVFDGEGGEHLFGALDDLLGDAGEFGDVDAVRLAGSAGEDSVEEDDFAFPLFDRDVEVLDFAGVGVFEVCEFVVVGCEEGSGAELGEVFGDCPCEGEAVEG